jgi:PadR family transcriptional regulator, regulatory protein PadR
VPKKGVTPLEADLLQGTLDLLVLQALAPGPAHGHTIAHVIEKRSDEVLQVEHGSLYPALHRLERRGWVTAKWEKSPHRNREFKYYRLSPAGRQHLAAEESRWNQMVGAISRVMRTT